MSMTALDPSGGGSGARSTRGRTPFANPRVRGEPVDFSATEVRLTFTEGLHNSATIKAVSSTLENTEGFKDATISFYYGVAPRTELFQGYVMDVADEQGAQGQLSFTLEVLGATKVMYEGKPRFWSNKSATSAISDLVSNSGIGYGGHTHDHLWKALAQTNESDWSFIVDLAKRIGFSVFVRYGVVLTYDPVRLFKESGPYTRLVSGLDDVLSTDRNLIEFNSASLSSITRESMGSKFGYFTTGNEVQTSKQTGDFIGYVFESTQVIRDQSEATVYTQAYDTKLAGWGETATARIWGDADLFPGMIVEVVTAAKRWYAPKTDGRWMVRGVGHQGDPSQYQTILFLTRPSQESLASSAAVDSQPYRPFWEDTNPGRARPFLTLINDLWQSSWAASQARGLM